MPYRRANRKDWCRAGVYILLTVAVIVVTATVLIPLARPIGLIAWLTMCVGGGLYLLVRWHARGTAYRCAVCGYEFEISAAADLLGPQYPNKKYLRCPQCGRRSWATVLMKEG